jgi:hypothetical protein
MARKTFVCNGADGELRIVVCDRLKHAPLLVVGGSVTGSVAVDPKAVRSSVCWFIGSCQSLHLSFEFRKWRSVLSQTDFKFGV